MARYQVILSYDGTEFHGFQRQGSERTVQVEVENALKRMGWKGSSILAAGRTDTGVHASGQVISFDMDWSHSTETMAKALNAHLPADIAVQFVELTNPDFHPRFDAQWRTYLYRIYFCPYRDPLRDRYAWRFWPRSEMVLPENAAEMFVGTHDFKSYGSPMKPGGNTVRTVRESFWVETSDSWCYQITANAFLRHMVRRVVHAQVLTAMRKFSLEELLGSIEYGAEIPPGIAPPHGLRMDQVVYEDGIAENNESDNVDEYRTH